MKGSKNKSNEQILWLKDRSKEWKAPAVVYEDSQFGTGYEPLGCTRMNVDVDYYWSTAVVRIHGEWKNYLPDTQCFVFVLKTRGSITDCTVKIKGRHVRTVATINSETIQRHQDGGQADVSFSVKSANPTGNEILPQWTEKERDIFASSTTSYFYLPFKDVFMDDQIVIDCEYVESLRLVQGYYYFRMPLTFWDAETSQSMFAPEEQQGLGMNENRYESKVKVRCQINHSNSMGVQDVKCPSHKLINFNTETNCLRFETHKQTDDQEYTEGLKINSTIHGNGSAFVEYVTRLLQDQNIEENPPIVDGLGRAFEIYFRYGATADSESLVMEKSQYEATYGNESDLGNYISVHCLNNPLRQSFNWQFSQAKRREKKDYNYNNQNDNFLVNDLDTSLASLGLFMTVTNPLAIRRTMPQQKCCLYLVINGGTSMQNVWDSSVVEAVSTRISTLEMYDAFGICVFNELKIRHFIAYQDEFSGDGHTDIESDDESKNEEKTTPHVYKVSDWSTKYAQQQQQGGQQQAISWRNKLQDEVRDWLESHSPSQSSEIRKALKNNDINVKDVSSYGINISTPLIQTLTYLESSQQEYKNHYFKQIAFIHYGSKNNSKNSSNSNDDEKTKDGDKMLKEMEHALKNGSGSKSQFDFGAEHDLGEQDLMNKIAFFYSPKAKEFLNIDPYNTRIYTIGVGARTNLAFLEYLSRNTRGFCARCFDPTWFTWDLTHFLDSIRAPFVSFDFTDRNTEPFEFVYTRRNNKGQTSQLSFPFPMPDLYLDRPLVLKYYIESPSKLKGLIVSGRYSKVTDQKTLITTKERAYAHVQGNDVMDNDLFPMEILLANEEIDYWHGDYWFKRENWLFQQSKNETDNPFLLFGSIDKEQAEKIIGDLSDQTGMASEFRHMISFCMTPAKFDEYTRQIQSEKEASRQELSRLEESLTFEESQMSQALLVGNQGNNSYQLMAEPNSFESVPSVSYNAPGVQGHIDSKNRASSRSDINNNNKNKKHKHSSPNKNILTTEQLKRIRNRQNKGSRKNNYNKVAAVAAVAILGSLGIATLLNPFDGSGGDGGGGDDFFDFEVGGDGCDCGDGDGCDGCDLHCDDECCVVM